MKLDMIPAPIGGSGDGERVSSESVSSSELNEASSSEAVLCRTGDRTGEASSSEAVLFLTGDRTGVTLSSEGVVSLIVTRG